MRLVDIKSSEYTEYDVYQNDKKLKYKTGDHLKISKYKNIFVKGYTWNWWSKVIFVINEIKNAVSLTPAISDYNREKNVGTFYKKE